MKDMESTVSVSESETLPGPAADPGTSMMLTNIYPNAITISDPDWERWNRATIATKKTLAGTPWWRVFARRQLRRELRHATAQRDACLAPQVIPPGGRFVLVSNGINWRAGIGES